MHNWLGKFLYAMLFVVVLPAALVAWARGAATVVPLPAWHSCPLGVLVIAVGLVCIALAMWTLWSRGHGLPMNAYPPSHFVSTGLYAVVPHPIYAAFVVVCIGVSLYSGSSSGLWFVTPVVTLACIGLVLGYELPDLQERFGKETATIAILPPADDLNPGIAERLRCYLTVLLPWVVLYEACVFKGIPSDAGSTAMAADHLIPFVPWTEAIYATPYFVVAALPFLLRTHRQLREFTRLALISFVIVFPILFFVPLVTGLSLPEVTGPWASLVRLERRMDSSACAFPSYHVIWTLIAARVLGGEKRWLKFLCYGWAVAVTLSCLTTRAHTLLDVAAAIPVFLVLVKAQEIWRWILNRAERLANSWREWRIGPLRIINHGAYAGAGAAIGMFLIDSLLAASHPALTISIFLGGVIGAAMWAQWVEGSPALMRPLGFYGGMIGTAVAALLAPAFGVNIWIALSAICFAAPAIQAIGRLRCLVQGCCHGAPSGHDGIRYTHPRSRVLRIAEMGGVPLHPTQVYSIAGNIAAALVLSRLLALHVRCTMICSVYLIISGLFRFVEERLRGEPQTPVYFGLRLYQWLAIASVAFGGFVSTVTHAPPAPAFTPRWSSLGVALVCGIAGWFVSGVDFPESNRRFARLT
jgi:protein-S-isoprenylcysteine O-methyltransferase Ste14